MTKLDIEDMLSNKFSSGPRLRWDVSANGHCAYLVKDKSMLIDEKKKFFSFAFNHGNYASGAKKFIDFIYDKDKFVDISFNLLDAVGTTLENHTLINPKVSKIEEFEHETHIVMTYDSKSLSSEEKTKSGIRYIVANIVNKFFVW